MNAQLAEGSLIDPRKFDAEFAIKQIGYRAVASEGVVDIFTVAGLKRSELELLSEEVLAEVCALPQRNLAAEMLERLLADEIKARGRRNVVIERKFSQLLEQSAMRYRNRAFDAAMVIQELLDLSRERNHRPDATRRSARRCT